MEAESVYSREAYTRRHRDRIRHQQEKQLESTKMWLLSLPQHQLDLRCHSIDSVKVDEFFHSTLYFQWSVRRFRKSLISKNQGGGWGTLIFEYMMGASGCKPADTYNLTDRQILVDAKEVFGVIDDKLMLPNLKSNGMLEHGTAVHRVEGQNEMRCWVHRISRDPNTIFETCRNEGLQFHSLPKGVALDPESSTQAASVPLPTAHEEKAMPQPDSSREEASALIHPIEISPDETNPDTLKQTGEMMSEQTGEMMSEGSGTPAASGMVSSSSDVMVMKYKDTCAEISAAIDKGAPIYDKGDRKGCYDIYKQTAEMILKQCSLAGVQKELRSALDLANRQPSFTKQAWTMRHAFDAILSGNIDTSDFTDSDKEEVTTHTMGYKDACLEISAAISRGAPTYNSGDHSGCYNIYSQTAEKIVDRCSVSVVQQKLRLALDLASNQSSFTDRAWTMRQSFDSILRLRSTVIVVTGLAGGGEEEDSIGNEGAGASEGGESNNDGAGADEKGMSYKDACREISDAISNGAPAYNSGDHEGCFNIYKQTAEKIFDECTVEGVRRVLRSALDQMPGQSSSTKRAWTLRHAFDAILEGRINNELGGSVRLSRDGVLSFSELLRTL